MNSAALQTIADNAIATFVNEYNVAAFVFASKAPGKFDVLVNDLDSELAIERRNGFATLSAAVAFAKESI